MRTNKKAAQAKARKLEKKAAKTKARRAEKKTVKKQTATCTTSACEEFYKIDPLSGQKYCKECNICNDCFSKAVEKAHEAAIDQIAQIHPGEVVSFHNALDAIDAPPCIIRDIMFIIKEEREGTCIGAAMKKMGVRHVANDDIGLLEQYRRPVYMSQEEYDSYFKPEDTSTRVSEGASTDAATAKVISNTIH